MVKETSQVSRHFPGEDAANRLLAYVKALHQGASHENPDPIRWSKQGTVWRSSHTRPFSADLQLVLQAIRDFRRLAERARRTGQQPKWQPEIGKRGPKTFEQLLYMRVLHYPFALDWDPGRGFTILCRDRRADALLALVELLRRGRLDRLRQCLRCRSWFYARFKHQRFCNDPEKKCQWRHYHTPEWRKKHREKNRRHQEEYRKRLFGKRRH